ncbi:hypothetical protein lpari_01836 [Legionella parisiensis]|uniref:Uncharacterized protein n=2 Tax=Legionella parisiensis TaxID=45071 RepID=A0A1E5JRL1_9GAMM|nr:hypothetical protein [Legionella parisiensis]OEH47171.1 hypothetical protein lpari_01836 [Legionella parisiensis]
MITKLEPALSLRAKMSPHLTMTKAIPQTIQKLFPFSPIQHPFAPIMQNSLTRKELKAMHIEGEELELIQQLHESNKFYILEDHNTVLKQFF